MSVYPPDTEAIYAALFALAAAATVNGAPAFKFTKRRMIQPEQCPHFPALLMEQLPEHYQANLNAPPIIHLEVRLWIFVDTPAIDDAALPATVINGLKDAVVAALAAGGDTQPNQTLGGLVSDAWIEGEILTDEGLPDQRGLVMIPVRILAMDAGC